MLILIIVPFTYTVKTSVKRKKWNRRAAYIREKGAGSIEPGEDLDHIVDLQLGGADEIANMRPLDRSVNRSLGAQIHHAIKDYKDGTVINRFIIE